MKKNLNIFYVLVLFLGDFTLYFLSFKLSYFIRFYWHPFISIFPPVKGIPDWILYLNFFKLTAVLWVISFLFTKVYAKYFLTAMDEFVVVLKGTTFSTLLFMAMTFIYREVEFSRIAISMIWLTSSMLIYLWHEIFKVIFQLFFRRFHNALIITNSENVDLIKKLLRKNKYIKPYFLMQFENIEDIFQFIKNKNIEEIYTGSSMFQ
ncbi:MAG: hypothetical protein AB1633_05430, partial [Elusimicrobiota bacterium]